MRALEAIVFLSLAAAVHVGFWTLGAGPEGATSAGGAGQQQVTISAATEAQTELVSRWLRPPEATREMMALPEMPIAADTDAPHLPPSSAQAPATERVAAKMEAPDTNSLPSVDTTSPAPPTSAVEQNRPLRPKPRPAKLDKQNLEAPQEIARPEQAAKGKAEQSQRGTAGRSDVNSQSTAATNALRAQWGSAIYAQVRRHMHFPRGVTKGGTAKLALRIASNGKLRDLRLTSSSGNADLDRAALRAVSRAGRFAKAPKGLPGDSHAFSLSLTFSR